MGAGVDQPLAVVVKHADRANSENVGDVHRVIPGLRIDFLVQTLPLFQVKPITISTVHFSPRPFYLLLGCLLSAAALAQNADDSMRYSGGEFIIRQNGHENTISATSYQAKLADKVLYRKDASFAVWDARGLTIRKGKKARTTRLPDVALTPKLFSRDEILKTKDLIASGSRSKSADALSGSVRIGDEVYFLARWDAKSGEPWLEALVSVDLNDSSLEPKLVGRFDGLSPAKLKTGDMLFEGPGSLAAAVAKPDGTWGIARYDIAAGTFSFKPVGENLARAWKLSASEWLAEEKTSYGSKTLARVNPETGERRILQEFRGTAELVSAADPVLIELNVRDGHKLLNLETGAVTAIPADARIKPSKDGVVVWNGGDPNSAVLYDPSRWSRLLAATGVDDSRDKVALMSRSHSRRGKRVQPAGHPNR